MYLCLSAYNSSVCLPVCQSVHRSVYLCICVSQFICLSVNWSVRQSVSLSSVCYYLVDSFVHVPAVYHLYFTTWLTVSYMSPLSIICILLPGWQFRICHRCLSSVCYYLVDSFVYVTTVYHLYFTTWLTVTYISPLSIICMLLHGWQFRICRRCLSSVCYYLVDSFVYVAAVCL